MLSTKQAAQQLNVAENTIRQLINLGHLPAIRVGKVFRVTEDSIREYIERHTVVAG